MSRRQESRDSGSGQFLFDRRNVHVEPSSGSWVVRRESGCGAYRTYATKDEAIKSGLEIARKEGVDYVIHGRDGRIRERDSFSKRS